MAKGNFGACLEVTLPHEGGYSDHPSDPGGATNMGITIGRLSEVRGRKVSKSEVKALTLVEAKSIYERYYWQPVKGDELPAGLDLAVFDFAVNSGPARAVRYLQSALKIAQDGKLGPDTMAAVQRANGKETIQALCTKRLDFMQGLGIWKTFKRGWSRRVAEVEAKAVAMVLAAASAAPAAIEAARGAAPRPAQVRNELSEESSKARRRANNQTAAGGAISMGSVSGGPAVLAYDWVHDPSWWLIGGAVGIALIVAVVLVAKAYHNKQREKAYATEAMKF